MADSMKGASWDTQRGLYTYLKADTQLMAMVRAVYDGVPPGQYNDGQQEQNFPYITIGDAEEKPDDSHTRQGSESVLEVEVWSRYQGNKEVKEVMGRLWALLHNTKWAVPDFSAVMSRAVSSRSITEKDGITRRGLMRVRVTVQEV